MSHMVVVAIRRFEDGEWRGTNDDLSIDEARQLHDKGVLTLATRRNNDGGVFELIAVKHKRTISRAPWFTRQEIESWEAASRQSKRRRRERGRNDRNGTGGVPPLPRHQRDE